MDLGKDLILRCLAQRGLEGRSMCTQPAWRSRRQGAIFRLNERGSAMSTGTSLGRAGHRWCAVLLSLVACLMIAGCAQHDSSSDQERPGGFYGGVSAGGNVIER